jgi:hypothetical protein
MMVQSEWRGIQSQEYIPTARETAGQSGNFKLRVTILGFLREVEVNGGVTNTGVRNV